MVYTITVHLHANDDPSSVEKLKAKLIEASRVYSQDKETVSWFVMQSTSDPRDFTIVERYEQESVSKQNLSLFVSLFANWKETGADQRESLAFFSSCAEPEVSPREPLLEDLRPIRHSPARQAHGLAPLRRAGYQQGHRRPCLGT